MGMVLLKFKNMKNLKKLMFGLVALVMGFGLVFSVSATKKKASIYWRYNKNVIADVRDGNSYSLTTPAEECEAGSDLPCVIEVDAAIDTQAKLNTFLNNMSTFPNESDIVNAALYKKAGE